jgi:hypothetical protein
MDLPWLRVCGTTLAHIICKIPEDGVLTSKHVGLISILTF